MLRSLTKISSCVRTSLRSATVSAHDVLAALPEAQVSTIGNGLRVASETRDHPTATVGVWIDAGSAYEKEENGGIAYFLEHMMYKGTTNHTKAQLQRELHSVGAKLNSFTSREVTAFYTQCASEDVEKVVEILADILRNPKLDMADIEKERSVVQDELDNVSPRDVIFDYMHAAAFHGTPLSHYIIGSPDSIKAVSQDKLRNYVEDNFKPVRMVLTGVGGIDHAQLVKISEKYFGDLKNDYARKVPVEGGIRFSGAELRDRNDAMPFMYAAIAVEGPPFGDPDTIPLELAKVTVGNWDIRCPVTTNSPTRLVQKVSYDLGLHQLECFMLPYRHSGLFGFYYVTEAHDILDTQDVARAIQKEWKHASTGIRDEEVDRAKNMLKTELLGTLECDVARADDVGRQVLYTGKVKSLASLEREIEAVDKTSMRAAINRNVYDREVVAVGYGRTEAFPNYHHVRYGMSWWRL